MKLTVLGCGRWGSFLATYHSVRNDVLLWGKADAPTFQELSAHRKNQYLTLPENLILESNLKVALEWSDTIIISISAQQLRSFAKEIQQFDVSGKTFILCMKGIEVETGKRLSQVMEEEILQDISIAVWVGPGHVQDFSAGIPNCMVVDSADPAVIERITENLSSDLIRLYRGADIIGTEVGAAAKNVVGIAAGLLDGAKLTSLKGALMARGAREVARLIHAMGGNELSAYGLCHLGDYEATLFSPHSHNRMFGECFILGKPYTQLAEGASTVKALIKLGEEYQVDLPICKVVHDVLYQGMTAEQAVSALFSRSVKGEFEL